MSKHHPPAITKTIIEKFGELCNWAYISWRLRKYLLEDHSDFKTLQHHFFGNLFLRLQYLIQEHWMLQLSKLHDPAIQSGRTNLTIQYVTDYGPWDAPTEGKLKDLKTKLEDFLYTSTKIARNKLIAHNDLEALLAGNDLGGFDAGKDEEYFKCLQEFVNIAHDKICGGPYPFDDLVDGDIDIFMSHFKKCKVP